MITNLSGLGKYPALARHISQEGLPLPSFVSAHDYQSGWLVVRWGCVEAMYDLDEDCFDKSWELMTGFLSRRIITQRQAYDAIVALELGAG